MRGVSYPATKRELVAMARENGAHEAWVEALRSIPDLEYARERDVWSSVAQKEHPDDMSRR